MSKKRLLVVVVAVALVLVGLVVHVTRLVPTSQAPYVISPNQTLIAASIIYTSYPSNVIISADGGPVVGAVYDCGSRIPPTIVVNKHPINTTFQFVCGTSTVGIRITWLPAYGYYVVTHVPTNTHWKGVVTQVSGLYVVEPTFFAAGDYAPFANQYYVEQYQITLGTDGYPVLTLLAETPTAAGPLTGQATYTISTTRVATFRINATTTYTLAGRQPQIVNTASYQAVLEYTYYVALYNTAATAVNIYLKPQ